MPNNIGAFGENFPYSNQHDMNMDWVIKIAKDFLDQYTSLQNVITQGLDELTNKANELETLLQAWYDEHSEDIADQLTDALNDLNNWYTEHQNYLNQTLAQNIQAFDEHAVQKAQDTIATIPDDYTALSNKVLNIQTVVSDMFIDMGTAQTLLNGVYNINTHAIENPLASTRHYDIDITDISVVYLTGYFYNANYPVWVILDASNTPIDHSTYNTPSTTESVLLPIPANGKRLIVNCSSSANNGLYVLPNIMQSIYNNVNPLVQHENTYFKTASHGEGVIDTGVWNVTTHEYVSPLASTRHIEVTVSENEMWYVAGYIYNASFPLWIVFDNQNNQIAQSMVSATGTSYEEIVIIPSNAVKLIVNCSTYAEVNYARKVNGFARNAIVNGWRDKTMVWLGTSIPAGRRYGLNNYDSYPMIVGSKLDCTVINESVGNSSVHCKLIQRIDPVYNPYGFVDDWLKCACCLTNTVQEMEWLCNNYNIRDENNNYVFQTNRPINLTNDDIAFYKSCSYEIKIQNHVNDVDIWVFDHGHNDNSYNDNIVNGQTKTDDEIEYLYGKNNLYTWQGACNFVFTYILNHNNKAKIIMIGEYDNRLRTVPPAQMKVAESWELPIYKQWEVIGWNTDHKITTTGYWDNETGYWIDSGGPEQEITVHDRFIRDHIHPSSDASGYATNHIAQLMAKWFINNAPIY